jgi:putative membrane protein
VTTSAATAGIPGWHPHPEVDLVLLLVVVGWWFATSRIATASRRQHVWFALGWLTLAVCSTWPVHDLAEQRLYSVHMAQHVGYTYVAPVLFLLALPVPLWAWIAKRPVISWFARWCTRPWIALIGFNLIIGLSHLQVVVNTVTPSEPLHFLAHLVIFGSALCFWAPIINRVDGLPSLKPPAKLLVLFTNAFLASPIVGALALAGKPVYEHYASLPRIWGISAVGDQQAAAAVMWIVESTWTLFALVIVFFDWYRNEQRDPATASLPEHIRRRPVPAP